MFTVIVGVTVKLGVLKWTNFIFFFAKLNLQCSQVLTQTHFVSTHYLADPKLRRYFVPEAVNRLSE